MTGPELLILGEGYCGRELAAQARAAGLKVLGVRRTPPPGADGLLAFSDPALAQRIADARYLVSSVPPDADGSDPMLVRFGAALAARRGHSLYLSSTGVYGDTGGAFVDESAPVGHGRRSARAAADCGWQALGATIFRLPGIYGPGRSAFDQLRAGTARRVDRPGHRFSRIHVADVAGAALRAFVTGADGVFNIVDDRPAEPRQVTEYAAALAGLPLPPLLPPDLDALPPAARGFWLERRLVAGGRMRRVLGYHPAFPDYKVGLSAIWRNRDP